MNRWRSGRVSYHANCGSLFDLQWWRTRCALLMRPNKVETAVPYVACRRLLEFLVMIIPKYICYIIKE